MGFRKAGWDSTVVTPLLAAGPRGVARLLAVSTQMNPLRWWLAGRSRCGVARGRSSRGTVGGCDGSSRGTVGGCDGRSEWHGAHKVANFLRAVLTNCVVKVCLPLVRQTTGGDKRGRELDTGSQSPSARRTMDSSSVSDANFMVTLPGEELRKVKCWYFFRFRSFLRCPTNMEVQSYTGTMVSPA